MHTSRREPAYELLNRRPVAYGLRARAGSVRIDCALERIVCGLCGTPQAKRPVGSGDSIRRIQMNFENRARANSEKKLGRFSTKGVRANSDQQSPGEFRPTGFERTPTEGIQANFDRQGSSELRPKEFRRVLIGRKRATRPRYPRRQLRRGHRGGHRSCSHFEPLL